MTDTQLSSLFAHSKAVLIEAQESFEILISIIRESRPDLYRDLTISHGGDDFTGIGSGGSRAQRADTVKRICERNWSPDLSDDENISLISDILHSLSFYAPLSSDTYCPIRRQAIRAGLITQD